MTTTSNHDPFTTSSVAYMDGLYICGPDGERVPRRLATLTQWSYHVETMRRRNARAMPASFNEELKEFLEFAPYFESPTATKLDAVQARTGPDAASSAAASVLVRDPLRYEPDTRFGPGPFRVHSAGVIRCG